MGTLEGKVAIVTGAGRGIGRGEALLLSIQGAKVVVNDVGGTTRGEGADLTPAQQVADEIKAAGGEAIVNGANVTDFAATKQMVDQAIEHFGRLDILVNNAGILRDRMVMNMSEDEWDAVIAVHLKGTFNCSRHAAAYWRERSKSGDEVHARIINTSSPSGLFGNAGQSNYGAAKAGIAAFTVIVAQELQKYGVTVNAVSPSARTRMTEETFGPLAVPEDSFDALAPENIAPLVAYLASDDASGITGQVFGVRGGNISLLQGWTPAKVIEREDRWEPADLAQAMEELIPGKQIQPDPTGTRAAAKQAPIKS